MKVAVQLLIQDILEGVGDKMQVVNEPGNIAFHVRRLATADEKAAFIKRKKAGDYDERIVAKGTI